MDKKGQIDITDLFKILAVLIMGFILLKALGVF